MRFSNLFLVLHARTFWSSLLLAVFLPPFPPEAASAPLDVGARVQGKVVVLPGHDQKWVSVAISRQPAGVDSLPAGAIRTLLW